MLLSFAQFEREVIGERVRDKIAASKRKGLWVGGPVPLGYRSIAKKLIVVEEEAEQVRAIFRRYLALGSIGLLIEDLHRCGVRPRARPGRDGGTVNPTRFMVGPLAYPSRTASTSAKSPIAAKSIPANSSRSSIRSCSRPCRQSSRIGRSLAS